MKQKLKAYIAQNKTAKAIETLLAITAPLEDQDLHQEVIIQSSRFEKYAEGQRQGTTTFEEGNIALAKVNKTLLAIINRLPEEALAKDLPSSTKADSRSSQKDFTEKSWWKYVAAAAVIIGILGSLAEVLNVINIFPSSSADTAQLTIYVHGPNGLQDYVLENEGELLVDLDGDRRYAKIGEKGRTVFNEIPSKFISQPLPIAIKAEGFEATEPKKQYEWQNKAIYFAVQPAKQLRQIKGIVKSRDGTKGLPDVLILIENEFTTTTDSLGRFSFEMNKNQAREKYSLTFQKAGYQSLSEYYYPNATQEFRLKPE